MWVYEQDSGWLCYGGARIAKGYAGAPGFINAHAAQELHNQGPLPCGLYRMSAAIYHPHLGPDAIPLSPQLGNTMFGRSDFFIHSDNHASPGNGSTGCICLPWATRQLLMTSTDKTLSVQLSPKAVQGAVL
jgi:hypothetical protein